MRINEWYKNRADGKGVGNAAGSLNAKKLYDISINSCKIKPEEDSFLNSLQKSMIQEEAMKEYRTKAEKDGRLSPKRVSRMEREIGANKAESINIRVEGNAAIKGAKEVPVRKIPYQECDMVEINVMEGYVLKAKREGEQEGKPNGYPVYIEKKSDDGDTKAYLFDGAHSRQDSKDEMERMAYAVMHTDKKI